MHIKDMCLYMYIFFLNDLIELYSSRYMFINLINSKFQINFIVNIVAFFVNIEHLKRRKKNENNRHV
jgi:hypothetical protein